MWQLKRNNTLKLYIQSIISSRLPEYAEKITGKYQNVFRTKKRKINYIYTWRERERERQREKAREREANIRKGILV
jgi:hypothetical protein